MAKAIADAQSRAKELAKSMKKRLGRMVSLQTEEMGTAATGVSKLDFQGTGVGQIGEIEISRTAVAVFELK